MQKEFDYADKIVRSLCELYHFHLVNIIPAGNSVVAQIKTAEKKEYALKVFLPVMFPQSKKLVSCGCVGFLPDSCDKFTVTFYNQGKKRSRSNYEVSLPQFWDLSFICENAVHERLKTLPCLDSIFVPCSTIFGPGIRATIGKWCEGGNLRNFAISKRWKETSWKIREAIIWNIVQQMLKAMELIWGIGIIHGDLKPENILVENETITDTSRIMICDFGNASDVKKPALMKHSTTTFYYPPNKSDLDFVDKTTDIWSMGVTAFELLTGDYFFPYKRQTSRRDIGEKKDLVSRRFGKKFLDCANDNHFIGDGNGDCPCKLQKTPEWFRDIESFLTMKPLLEFLKRSLSLCESHRIS